MQIRNQYSPWILHILIFPSKVWAKQCALSMAKQGQF